MNIAQVIVYYINKIGSMCREGIAKITWVIKCKHGKRGVRQLDITIETWGR